MKKDDAQKFEEYCSSVYEAFNSPLNISWEMNEKSLIGFFSIGSDYYKIFIKFISSIKT